MSKVYYLSSGVGTGISVKILLVELEPALGCFISSETPRLLAGSASEVCNSPVAAIFLTAQVFSDELSLHSMVICSKSPIKCRNSSIYKNDRPPPCATAIGGSTISFFTKQGVLRDAVQCLRILEGREVDSFNTTATLSEIDEDVTDSREYGAAVTRADVLGPFCLHREDVLLWLEMLYFSDVVVYEEEPYLQHNLTPAHSPLRRSDA
ncbi:hypothetical protein PF004_g26752 [Phytophthora fragariae]|uniref:Uncharacterized protein n=1 Tax=Phytophthora fragariae TaxID=53985 RepID=A0A6G0MNB9_9STRA|nr:hypothetical protein PF004_g26752 [Phytophthora fragariae]